MLNPHVMTFVVATLGVGWLMAYAWLSKSALELKRRKRICPSCGRQIRAQVCPTCAG